MADRVGVSMAKRTCSVEGCPELFHALGMCKIHYLRAYRAARPDVHKASQAAYRADPERRERARIATAAWRVENAEHVREANRRYHRENPEKIREQKRRYREANRDAIRTSNNRRKALHRGAEINDLTGAEWAEIKAAYGHRCAYCGCKPKRLTQDHVIPLAKGGHHTASNVVPACQPCNSRKGDRAAPTYQPLLM